MAFARPMLVTERTEFDAGAERVAFELAHRCRVALRAVVPYVTNPEFEVAAPALFSRAQNDAADRADALRAAAAAAGVDATVVVRGGPEMYVEVLEQALEDAVDLIVARRRGRRGFLARALIGDMVRHVITHASCPLLIVPQDAALPQRQVLLAIDPAAPSAGLIGMAIETASICSLPMHLLCVAAEAGDPAAGRTLAAAADAANGCGLSVTTEVGAGHHIAEQILQTAVRVRADLIAVARHSDDVRRHAWLGGVAHKVIGLADCPVLVFASATAGASP